MKFNYADSYIGEEKVKWNKFDEWLEKLSEEDHEEFSKELYTSYRFMSIGVSSSRNDIIYNPSSEVPNHIKEQIKEKLLEIWPPKGK